MKPTRFLPSLTSCAGDAARHGQTEEMLHGGPKTGVLSTTRRLCSGLQVAAYRMCLQQLIGIYLQAGLHRKFRLGVKSDMLCAFSGNPEDRFC